MIKNSKTKCWIVLAAVFLTGVSMAWSQNKVIPIISDVMSLFKIDSGTAGLLSSVFCITSVIMAVPAVYILKGIGIKKSGLLAMVFTAIGSLIGIISPNFTILFLSRIVEGVGVGMISVIGPAAISMWFPCEKRGLPMGIWGSWQMVAQGGNFFLATYLTRAYSWKGMWYFGIALTILAGILYGFIVKTPNDKENYAPINKGEISKEAFRSKSTWYLSLAGCCFTFAYFGWCTWISQYWTDVVGVVQDTANDYLGYLCIIEIPVVFVIGAILDRIKDRKSVAIISAALYIPILLYSFYMKNVAMLVPFIILYPIIEGGIPTFLWTVVPETVKDAKDSSVALALLTIWMNIGTVIGPPITGMVIENFGWHIVALPLCGMIAILILFVKKVELYQQ